MVAEVRDVRNVSQQHVHKKTVSGPTDKVDITMSFDRASCADGDAQYQVAFFL